MHNQITIGLRGFNQVQTKLRQYVPKAKNATEQVLANTADKIAADARANCTVPSIANEIHTEYEGGYYLVRTDTPLSAYWEFGTGYIAAEYVPLLPKDFQELAMQFYVNGKGRLPAHPYLYPAFVLDTLRITDDIKQAI